MLLGILFLAVDRAKGVSYLMQAHRSTRQKSRQIKIESIFRKKSLLSKGLMRELVVIKEDSPQLLRKRIFILKEPTMDEKGVLIVSFDTFGYLGLKCDMDRIFRDYFLVLEPSWAGYCTPELMQFLDYNDTKIIVQATEKLDFDFLERLSSNLIPVKIGASNWVDERVFKDLGLEKEYDSIMIAQWGEFKRHHIYFDAIRKTGIVNYKACLVGAAWGGRTKQDIEELIAYYGLEKNIDIFEKLNPEDVNVLLNKSKVGVLLSLKEGSNRAIFEGIFANVPAIVLKDNIGVNKDYINNNTGVLINRDELPEMLIHFRGNWHNYKPREWAMNNISCTQSTQAIEKLLRNAAAELNIQWTRCIEVKVNRPEFEYYDRNVILKQIDLNSYK
jgi:glycosyltransferase involved in cell wall biosynthesis